MEKKDKQQAGTARSNERTAARSKIKSASAMLGEYEVRDYANNELSQEQILNSQRPAKLCSIAKRCGYGEPVLARHNAWAKWIRLTFSSGLELLIRPLHVEIWGKEIVDEQLEDYLRQESRCFEDMS